MTRQQWLRLSAALGAGLMLPKGLQAALPEQQSLRREDFGPGFVWGTATAAYQTEGGWNEDGKGESNWDHFTHHTRKVKTHANADVADDFYHRYASDIQLMQQMNIPAFRFSLCWSRILPDGSPAVNPKGIDFYNRVIDTCLAHGISPWVTCYHWDMPQPLEARGGWANRDMLGWFSTYIETCGKYFGDRVKNWMIINEPDSFTLGGYLVGKEAPGKINFSAFYKAVHHVVLCQAEGGRILRNLVQNGNIGTTFSCMPVDGWHDKPANIRAAKRVDVVANRMFIEPALGMGYPAKDLHALRHVERHMQAGDEKRMPFDFDFTGLQNYTRWVVRNLPLVPIVAAAPVKPAKMGHDLTEMGWEVYPEGMYRILKEYAAYPGIKKIVITENGAAIKDTLTGGRVHDNRRTQYIQDYLRQVLKAKREGIDIGGYFIWSFTDNFEWAEGYRPTLGLVAVDYKTQQRTIKDSGRWYADFLAGR